MSRTELLAQRRALLVTECALQRITLIGQTQSLLYSADWVTSGSHLVNHLKSLPGWLSALLVGLVIVVPGRAVSWAKNGLLIWQAWRAVSGESVQI